MAAKESEKYDKEHYREIMAEAGDITLESMVLLSAGFILVMFLYISICNDNFNWFERSGSIVTLLCAWIQARNYNIQQKINMEAVQASDFTDVLEELDWGLPKNRRNVQRVTIGMLILGTAVWGFGGVLG